MSVDILGTSVSMVQYCFTSTETRRVVRTQSPGRPGSTFTQLLNSVYLFIIADHFYIKLFSAAPQLSHRCTVQAGIDKRNLTLWPSL